MQKTIDRRYWLITFNNPPQDYKRAITDLGPKWAIGQLEQGQSGTPHIQALLFFPDRLKNSFWTGKQCFAKAIPSVDAERTVEYCTKEEGRLEAPFRIGHVPPKFSEPGAKPRSRKNFTLALETIKTGRVQDVEADILIPHIRNLLACQALLKEPLQTTFCRLIWLYGKSGTGKTTFARSWFKNWINFWDPDLEDKGIYYKAPNKWWCGYQHQAICLLDDLPKDANYMAYYLKKWGHEHPETAEIKGGTVGLRHLYLVITSQFTPSDIFTIDEDLEAISRRTKFITFQALGRPSEYPDNLEFGNFGINRPSYLSQFIS